MLHYYFNHLLQFTYQHSILFLAMVISSVFIIFMLFMFFNRPKKIIPDELPIPISSIQKIETTPTEKELQAIAGEDLLVTQLDLARAYIELGKMTSAKLILEQVLSRGNTEQQKAAQELLAAL